MNPLRSPALLFALLGFAVSLPLGFLSRSVASEKPNILFILVDDQAPETLGAYGNSVCQTPNIDRLAKEGILIRDAHHMGSWSGAVCRPSRTMIMTGRDVWSIRSTDSGKAKQGDKKADKQSEQSFNEAMASASMPALFGEAGYKTFRSCKRGNTFPDANKLFGEVHDQDMREGNDEQGSAWHAEHALRFLKQQQAEENPQPFLLFLGFSHPHDPRNGKPELLQKYGAANLKEPPTELNPQSPPLPINYLPKHPFEHGHPNLRDEVAVEGVMTDRAEATIRNEIGREYACSENIDVQVGRVLAQLEAMGELENTFIFYTADHGIAVGRHGLTGKQNLYEHTWRVPFLVRGPGIAAGSQASGMFYLSDVLPTLCDLAGLEVPQGIEGRSFGDVLKGEQNQLRDRVYGVYCGGTKPGMRSLKTADGWKLIKYDVLDGQVHQTQLFNLKENPHELLVEHQAEEVRELLGHAPNSAQVNLADDPRYAAKRLELEQQLLDEQIRLRDPYRLWDQPQQ